MKRIFRFIRYSWVGVFFAGIIGVIQGCSVEREGALFAVLLLLLNFCSGPVATDDSEAPTFTLTVTATGAGSGMVTGTGINCTITAGSTSGDCTETGSEGTVISLTASFDPGSAFAAWTTCDLSAANLCNMTLSADKTATVNFIENFLGAAKQMFSTTDGLPETVTIDYVFENLSAFDDIFSLSALDDLFAIFGVQGVDWTFTAISSVPAAFANPSFNGNTVMELIHQAPTQNMVPLSTATITVVIELLTFNSILPGNQFCNQVIVTGTIATAVSLSDESTDGSDPDPGGDGLPEENAISCFTFF